LKWRLIDKRGEERDMYIKLEGGITRRSLATWEQYKDEFKKPVYILITFHHYDMVQRGYYIDTEEPYRNNLNYIDTPSFIIKNKKGDELWLDGCNCGYGGEGPNGSKKILKDIGISDELIQQMFYRDIFELELNNGTYNLIGDGKSVFRNNTAFHNGTIKTKNGKLIFISDEDRNYDIDQLTTFTTNYAYYFLQNLKHIKIFASREEAIDQGYYTSGRYGRESAYRFILIGDKGKEIWVNPVFEGNTKVSDESAVRTLMDALEVTLKEPTNPKVEWIRKNLLSRKPVSEIITIINE
jgi:hypothetical protein